MPGFRSRPVPLTAVFAALVGCASPRPASAPAPAEEVGEDDGARVRLDRFNGSDATFLRALIVEAPAPAAGDGDGPAR